MKTRQKEHGKDQQAKAGTSRTQVGIRPLSLSEVERVVRACFQVSDQTGERGNRGDGGQR